MDPKSSQLSLGEGYRGVRVKVMVEAEVGVMHLEDGATSQELQVALRH